MEIFTAVFVSIFGACIGSFLNVCIYRLPLERSVVTPGSACPHCKKSLSAGELIPVFSFLIQGGKCRSCGARVSWIYPVVEILTALIYLFTYLHFGMGFNFIYFSIFLSSMVVIFFIDLEHRLILNTLTFPGIGLGILGALLYPHYPFANLGVVPRLLQSILGTFAAGGIVYFLAWFGEKLFKKEAMGGGDIKFMAFVGSVLGWKFGFVILYLSCVLGAVIGVSLIIFKKVERKAGVPFGPFMVVSTFIMVFHGNEILSKIVSLYLPR